MDIFSKRNGYHGEVSIQHEDINADLRNRIWNSIYSLLSNEVSYPVFNSLGTEISNVLWDKLFKKRLHELIGHSSNRIKQIHSQFFPNENQAPWYVFYDAIELICEQLNKNSEKQKDREKRWEANEKIKKFTSQIGLVLKEENSGYSLINNLIAPITTKVEIEQIETALGIEEKDAAEHLEKALKHLSDRVNPDYANAVKESVSSLEGYLRERLGSTDQMSELLKDLRSKKSLKINPILLDILTKINAYRGEVGGVGHSSKDGQNASAVEKKEALLFVVIASAFINYLKQC